MNENLALIYQSLPYLLKGCAITIVLVGGALGLGFVIGIPMAVGQVQGFTLKNKIIITSD